MNAKGKRVATTTLVPGKQDACTKTSNGPIQPVGPVAVGKPTAAGTVAVATAAGISVNVDDNSACQIDNVASSGGGKPQQTTSSEGRKEATASDGMESLCAQVKQAWTTDVASVTAVDVAREEVAADGVGEEAEKDMQGQRVSVTGGNADCEDGENEHSDGDEAEDSDGQTDGTEDEGEEESDDDDDWEPEEETTAEAQQGKTQNPSSSVTWAPPTTTEGTSFASDDFPALGGGETAKCAPIGATADTAASTSPEPLSTSSSASSWSLMARSNPAPFKATIKADPTPLPAATPIPKQEPGSTETFSKVAAGATGERPDGKAAGSSRILSTASGFGVTSGVGREEDDGEGWVSLSNIKSHKMAGIGLNGPSQSQQKGAAPGVAAGNKCRAGCVTTDFAMQNVILQVSGIFFFFFRGLNRAQGKAADRDCRWGYLTITLWLGGNLARARYVYCDVTNLLE